MAAFQERLDVADSLLHFLLVSLALEVEHDACVLGEFHLEIWRELGSVAEKYIYMYITSTRHSCTCLYQWNLFVSNPDGFVSLKAFAM